MKAPSARRVVSWSPFAICSSGADQAAGCVEDQGIAAVEDGKGRERVEAGIEGAERGGGGLDAAFE